MHYILIIAAVFHQHAAPVTAEFNSKEACEAALTTISSQYLAYGTPTVGVCARKGE